MLFFSDTQQTCSLNMWHCLSWCIRWTGKHTNGSVSYSFLHSPPTVTPLGPVWAMSPLILACPLGSLASSSSGTSVIFSVLGAFSGSSDLAAPFKLTCWRNFSMSSWLTNKEKSFEEFLKNKNYLPVLVLLKQLIHHIFMNTFITSNLIWTIKLLVDVWHIPYSTCK